MTSMHNRPKWQIRLLQMTDTFINNQVRLAKIAVQLMQDQNLKRKAFWILLPLIAVMMLIPLCAGQAKAYTVYCTNCSNNFTQELERITNLQQLKSLMDQYTEAVSQTEQQIRMVQQNMEQYANMVQNTIQLPQGLVNELKGNMTRLAGLTGQLKTQRGDLTSLGEIFAQMFPEQSDLKSLAGASTPEQVAAAVEQYRHHWDTWSQEVDRAAQATFQLSGQQLEDLQQDADRFQAYLDNMLSSPEGQMQAAMAGNQLAAIQVQEARELRSLMATKIQSDLQTQMKDEKEGQMAQEWWRDVTSSDQLKNLQSVPDPF